MTIHTLPLSGAGRGRLWTSLKDGFGAGFRWVTPVAMTVLCLWTFEAKLGLPSLAELGHTLATLPAWGWLGASIATAISFWALGR
jgi:phosphatidylglycerol lysyltransferase